MEKCGVVCCAVCVCVYARWCAHARVCMYANAWISQYCVCDSRWWDAAMQRTVWDDADAFYCSRFGGDAGGAAASRLSMLPLLKEIVTRIQAAASGAGHRLLVFSGHDTVVAPLLAALGALHAPGACRWPPYASHVAIELWALRERREVRVLFNGQPVTRYVTGCGEQATETQTADLDQSEFCPLESLVNTIETLDEEFKRDCGRELKIV